ncbi:MAG TPA: hypothetical protein VJP87_06460 [Candidatus Acidoferrales bacterium]|nr:hypothetical protein [Candidatus Acidoferrales bacterium]
MMPRQTIPALVLSLGLLALSPTGRAGSDRAADEEAPKAAATTNTAAPVPQATTAKAETPGITFGLEERIRFEGYNNTDFNDVKHDRLNQLRMRTRPSVDINFNKYFEGYFMLGWEGVKRYSDPSFPLTSGGETGSPFMAGELWVSNAYIKVKQFPGLENLSLQAGRFNIVKGDGWLFSDPSAVDGSRDGYDNAFDFAYRHGRSRFELIGVDNPAYDEFFPTVNKTPIADAANPANSGAIKNAIPASAQAGKQLQEWNQTALGIYYTNREFRNTDLDAYGFFDKDYGDIRKPTSYLYQPDRRYFLFGGRIVQRVKSLPGVTVTAEFAYEAGAENSMSAAPNFDLRAWGGFAYLRKSFRVKFSPYIIGGYWALSGQKANSRTDTEFEPMLERTFNTSLNTDAPSWSEFYAFSYGYEIGTYYWTNLKMPQVEGGFSPAKRATIVVGYADMNAMQPFAVNPFHAAGSVQPAVAPAGVFGSGLNRGQLVKTKVIYKLTPNVQGYLSGEKFFPGDFYVPQRPGLWFRADITYKFKGFVPFHKGE